MNNRHPLEPFLFCPICGKKEFHYASPRSKKCEACGFEYYANAAAAVAAIILNSNGEILLTTRGINPQKGRLDLPGGFVEFNESAEQALKREIQEELGVEIASCEYLFSYPNKYIFANLEVRTLDLFFTAVLEKNQLISCGDDVCSAQYYAPEAIPTNQIAFESIKNGLERYIKIKSETKLI